jgi:hypothetical protein
MEGMKKNPSSPSIVRLTKLLALLSALTSLSASAGDDKHVEPARGGKPAPRVQIALLLDNSGSMSGLLNQARTQLWKVVNEFTAAKRGGKPVRLEIALYEYGDGVVKMSPLTQDLDKVSEQLFGLGIRGGDEFCGQVIQRATRELEWSGDPDDLKLIYIAGNEPFTQGPVGYREAINEAVKKGIVVNTIHCGGDEASWRAGALAAGGNFMMIDQNAKVAQIVAPQDAEIARLGGELNKTYLGYGAMGAANTTRQKAQDKKAEEAAPEAMVQRSVSKSSKLYDNSGWDLVDGTKNGAVKLDGLADEQLPEEMRKMDKDQRAAFVATKSKERDEIQKKIAKLNDERKQHIATEMKKGGGATASTLDTEMIKSVRTQGEARAYSFE